MHDDHASSRSEEPTARAPAPTPGPGPSSEASWPPERVIAAAQRGEHAAIATLVSDSQPHVRRFARSLCASPEDAEDAAQEALIILYRKIGTLRATAALGSWLFKVVMRECHRRSMRVLRPDVVGEPSEPSAEDALLVRLEVRLVVDAIAALPAEQRAVVVLRDLHGQSGAATARALGLSRAAMKSRLHRGRQTLRLQLGAPSVDAPAACPRHPEHPDGVDAER
jgi:RNA polymerase sigma factor (sigma-70 family)